MSDNDTGNQSGGDIGSAFINGLFNVGSGFLNNYFGKKVSKKEYQRAIELWNMQNEYNKPVNQMARLREAGLNPNLVAGSLSNSVAGSIHNPSIRDMKSPLDGLVRDYQDLRQQDAQTQNLYAQKSLINSQAREAKARADIAEHNYNLISGTDYIQGEGFLQRILRKSVGKNNGIKQVGEGNSKKDVIVYDKDKPAVGSNVKFVPEGWFPRFW